MVITATEVEAPEVDCLNASSGLKSWLLTQDHKRIALLYLISVTFFFMIGGFFAMLIRIELATPAGDLVDSNTYNKLFFSGDPRCSGKISSADDDRSQGSRLSAAELAQLVHLHVGGCFTLFVLINGGVDTGWTFYTPFISSFWYGGIISATLAHGYVIAAGLGIFINGFSAILTGLNFVVTIHRGATGLEWQTASPPPTENFEVTPVATSEAYDYARVQSIQTPRSALSPTPERGDGQITSDRAPVTK